ncbi:MAG TPA: acyclic terpene utilization AtuA family protein [bacterium]|nr:acyclic terpene utilization AtuA family protein [bacterium]
MTELRALSPGKLGHGFSDDGLQRAFESNPDYVGIDAGSTDMGPFYMGTETSFFHEISIKRDLQALLRPCLTRKIPLVIGSAVTIGTKRHLAMALRWLDDVARNEGITCRVAVVQTEQEKSFVKSQLRAGRIRTLGAFAPLDEESIDASKVIVAQIGVEPLLAALDTEADIVLAGRCCDDAIFAAPAVRRGYDQGLALHMGKIMECASMCSIPPDLHGPMIGRLGADNFVLEPPEPHRRCTVQSVAAHALYERENPYRQAGPGGVNDLSECTFTQVSERAVRVSGSRWVRSQEYAVKLEGVRHAGYRCICLGGARDPQFIAQVDSVLAGARADAASRFRDHEEEFALFFKLYGRDAVMGDTEPDRRPGHELGVFIEVIGKTQELADAVCMYVRGTIQHAGYPGQVATAGNLAYPFAPVCIPTGEVYRFHIDHLMVLDDPLECVQVTVETVG